MHSCSGTAGTASVFGSRTLTPGEMSSLEKVADLRGKLGRIRSKVRKAHRLLLEHEHVAAKPGYPIEALELLSAALEEK